MSFQPGDRVMLNAAWRRACYTHNFDMRPDVWNRVGLVVSGPHTRPDIHHPWYEVRWPGERAVHQVAECWLRAAPSP